MFGLSAELIDGAADQDGRFAIWRDNAATLDLFLACATQWRIIAGLNRVIYQGLDYASLEIVMRLLKVPDQIAMFNAIQAMERAALQVFNSGS